MTMSARTGPLDGIRIVEVGGIGPAPFCGMLLADQGADVIRIDRRAEAGRRSAHPVLNRRSLALDLKDPHDLQAALALIDTADAVVEGFRPGVAERLGLGPDVCLARNPKLVYGRMTGYGQDGQLAQEPGHDINYIGLTGALGAIGPSDKAPPVPLNLVGDMGGGGMLLALGITTALLRARADGEGQVVDAAMVDGPRCNSPSSTVCWPRVVGPTDARRTSSTAPLRSTAPTAARTAGSSPLHVWNRSSMPRHCACSGSATSRCSPTNTTARHGLPWPPASPSCSRHDLATRGPPGSKGKEPV